MKRLAAYEKQMLASPDQQISLTDPDSRSMATSGRGSGVVGYNVQVAVETENHLIVTHEVTTSGSDRSQLARVGKAAKAVMRTDTLEAVADRGYFNSPEILACQEAGITVTLPKPMTSGAKAEGRFGKQDFIYVATQDAYICPAGERLTYRMTTKRTARRCGATGRRRAAACPLKNEVHDGARATHHTLGARACARSGAGSVSTPIRRRCAGGARRSSIRSERSRPGWAPRTS